MQNPTPATSPLLIGAVLLGAGLALQSWKPHALNLPGRPEGPHRDRGAKRVARKARDIVAAVMPANLTGSIGRTFLIMGAGLVLVRLLDMAADESEQLF